MMLSFVLAAALAQGELPSEKIVDHDVGYQLQLPEGWERMPREVLEHTNDQLKSVALDAPPFLEGFQPASHEKYFEYPYALLQVHPCSETSQRQYVGTEELAAIARRLTNAQADLVSEGLQESLAELIGSPTFDSTRTMRNPPGFVQGITLQPPGGASIRGMSVSLLGKTNVVTLHFYAPSDEWSEHAKSLQEFTNSFARTPDQHVSFRESSETQRQKQGSTNKLIAQGMVGAMVAGLAALASKRRSSRANAANQR